MLLPCPAGHKARTCNSDDEMFYVVCLNQNCFWVLGEGYDRDAMPNHAFRCEEDAVTAWNSRATPPDVTERARRAAKRIANLISAEDDIERRLADIIAAEFGGE